MGKCLGLVNNGNRSSTDKVLKGRLNDDKERKEEGEVKIAVRVRRESEERGVRKKKRFWPVAPIERVPARVRGRARDSNCLCVFTGDCIQWLR